VINKNIKKIKPVNIGLVDIEFMKKTENNFLRYPSPLESINNATENNKHIFLKLKELDNNYVEKSDLKRKKQAELLKDSSLVLKKLSLQPDILEKMETSNYRIALCLAMSNYKSYIFFKDLNAGIDNLLFWEYDIMGEHNFYKENNKEFFVLESKVTIIFEDELKIQNSPEFINDFICEEQVASLRNSLKNKPRCKIEDKAVKLFAKTSILSTYLDDETVDVIRCSDEYFCITVDVNINSGHILSIIHELNGVGKFLLFERWLWKKCLDWKNDSFFKSIDLVPFEINKIEFSYNYIFF